MATALGRVVVLVAARARAVEGPRRTLLGAVGQLLRLHAGRVGDRRGQTVAERAEDRVGDEALEQVEEAVHRGAAAELERALDLLAVERELLRINADPRVALAGRVLRIGYALERDEGGHRHADELHVVAASLTDGRRRVRWGVAEEIARLDREPLQPDRERRRHL